MKIKLKINKIKANKINKIKFNKMMIQEKSKGAENYKKSYKPASQAVWAHMIGNKLIGENLLLSL